MSIDNLIIDGTNLEFRIFYVSKTLNGDIYTEEQRNYIFRYLQTFQRIIKKFEPVNIYAAWDKKTNPSGPNFRKIETNDTYKLGRIKHPDIQELYDGEILLIELLETLGVKNMFPYCLEADDICSWLVNNLSGQNVLISSDHDLLQLVSPTTSLYNLKEHIVYDKFEREMGIKPELYALFKSIKGDTSDNIDGLRGYGEIKARKLAKGWDGAEITEEQRKLVEKNLRIIDLKRGYNIQENEEKNYREQFEYLQKTKHDLAKFKSLCEKYEFNTITKNICEWQHMIKSNEMYEFMRNLV